MTNGPITNISFADIGQSLISITGSLINKFTSRLANLLACKPTREPPSADKYNSTHRNAYACSPNGESRAQRTSG